MLRQSVKAESLDWVSRRLSSRYTDEEDEGKKSRIGNFKKEVKLRWFAP